MSPSLSDHERKLSVNLRVKIWKFLRKAVILVAKPKILTPKTGEIFAYLIVRPQYSSSALAHASCFLDILQCTKNEFGKLARRFQADTVYIGVCQGKKEVQILQLRMQLYAEKV